MVKDQLGNVLKVGDIVHLTITSVIGTVSEIDEGSNLSIGGRLRGQPGKVQVTFQVDALVEPQTKMATALVRVVLPEQEAEKAISLLHQ